MINLRFYVTGTATYYDFDCIPIYGSDWWVDRPNQKTIQTLDGTIVTVDLNPTIVYGNLLLKSIRMRSANDIRTFFETETVLRQYPFTIKQYKAWGVALDSGTGIDLGSGKGVTIENVYLQLGITLDSLFKWEAPGYYNLELPYMYRRV